MVSSQARFLKFESHGDLRAMHRDLIDEAGGVVVHIKKPIANLGKEVPGDLAPDCSISLTDNLRADSKAANIAFRRQVERLIKIVSPKIET